MSKEIKINVTADQFQEVLYGKARISTSKDVIEGWEVEIINGKRYILGRARKVRHNAVDGTCSFYVEYYSFFLWL